VTSQQSTQHHIQKDCSPCQNSAA